MHEPGGDLQRRAPESLGDRGADVWIPRAMYTDPDTLLRGRVLVTSSFGLGVLTLLIDIVRFLTLPVDLNSLLILGVVAVLFALPWVQWRSGSHRLAGGLLVGVCLVAFTGFHVLQGMFPAPVLVGFPVLPLIATFFVGRRFGYLTAGLLAVDAVVLKLALPPPDAAQVFARSWTFAAMAGAVTLMCALLTAVYERARARAHVELEAMNLALEEARARAEAESRSKSEFLRHVSHELRTPLNAILGYGELLQEELVEGGQDRLVGDVARIRGASGQLLALINDLLDISRIEAGAVDLEFAEFEVVPLLHQVREIVLPLASTNQDAVIIDAPADIPALVTDERRLRQVLLNLASNACKFTERGRIVLAATAEPTAVVLAVRDTGVGMTPEQCARVFEPFVQFHSAERRRQGSGLGLSLSRRLVQQLGGTIEVHSEVGRGTEFVVRLPLRRL